MANNSLRITAIQPKDAELIGLSCGPYNSILQNLELRQSCSEVAICKIEIKTHFVRALFSIFKIVFEKMGQNKIPSNF